MTDDHHWYRSSPWAGLAGGTLVAASVDFGLGPHRFLVQVLMGALDLAGLFDAQPVVGYGGFALAGALLGWVFRRVEDALGVY